jgi:hypothetical protein
MLDTHHRILVIPEIPKVFEIFPDDHVAIAEYRPSLVVLK